MSKRRNPSTDRARSLRETQTKSEGLLWGVLRAKQLCGLQFRRQHPIGPFYVDFACVAKMLVVEIDGECHADTAESDKRREEYLRENGWQVVRFSTEDVEKDAEVVAKAIAESLGLEFVFRRRDGSGSGMENAKAPRQRRL